MFSALLVRTVPLLLDFCTALLLSCRVRCHEVLRTELGITVLVVVYYAFFCNAATSLVVRLVLTASS